MHFYLFIFIFIFFFSQSNQIIFSGTFPFMVKGRLWRCVGEWRVGVGVVSDVFENFLNADECSELEDGGGEGIWPL